MSTVLRLMLLMAITCTLASTSAFATDPVTDTVTAGTHKHHHHHHHHHHWWRHHHHHHHHHHKGSGAAAVPAATPAPAN